MPTTQSRMWALLISVLLALLGAAGVLLVRELDSINSRLDRVTDYVLAQPHR